MAKLKIKSLFISDIHIGVKRNNIEGVNYILKYYEFENLFLLGDIFDLVSLKNKFRWHKEYNKFVNILSNLDCNIIYLLGNHEHFLRSYAPFNFGKIQVKNEYIYKNKLLIHGDKFDGMIYKLNFLYFFGMIAYDVIICIDYLFGHNGKLSKTVKKRVKESSSYFNRFFKTAAKYTKFYNCEEVICGHLHAQEYKEVDGIKYFNCGNFREDMDFIIETMDERILLCTIKEGEIITYERS